MIQKIIELLSRYTFRFRSEAELQSLIAQAFRREKLEFYSEYNLGPRDRIDFLVAGGTGIECKVKGRNVEVERQLIRYDGCPHITGLVLVTTKPDHLRIESHWPQLGSRPLRVVQIQRGL